MKSSTTKKFRKALDRLPEEIREQVIKAYEIWQSDPYQGSLQFKLVSQRQPIYSVRVGLNYRVLGLPENEHIYWFWIGSHAEYDELLKRL
jgi:mRNA-degrading endonuclease RelE of RelBE toxin-antitoxin system